MGWWLALWALDAEVPGSIPNRVNLGMRLLKIISGQVVCGPKLIVLPGHVASAFYVVRNVQSC